MTAPVAAPERTDARAEPSRSGIGWLTALAGYVLVFGALAARFLPELARAIPERPNLDDAHVLSWVLGWVAHALATQPTGVYDANVSYPTPDQLTGTDPLFASQILFAPIYAATGNAVLGANLVVLLSYPLGALAMDRLLRRFAVAPEVSWAAGLVFALGLLRVPFNLNALAYPNLFLPWTALALTRLRDEPSARRAAVLLLAFSIGMMTGLYAAILLAATVLVWGLFELAREAPGRARFLGLAALVAVITGVVFLAVHAPYLALETKAPGAERLVRLATPTTQPGSWLGDAYRILGLQVQAVALPARTKIETLALGGVALLAILVWALRTPAVKREPATALVPRATVLWIVFGMFAWGYPEPLASLIQGSPLASFRYLYRYVVVADFGLVLLLAIALQGLGALTGTNACRVATLAMVVVVLWGRGIPFANTEMHRVSSFEPGNRKIYEKVGRQVKAEGGGALLELPILGRLPGADRRPRTLEPDAMLASTLHWLPTPGAHLSYHAPQRAFFLQTVEKLSNEPALEDLIDTTQVRWILVRPDAYWAAGERKALLEHFSNSPSVRLDQTYPGDWMLFRVEREPEHEAWFETLKRRDVRGRSVLGTSLDPIPEEAAKATVRIASNMPDELGGGVAPVAIRVRNDGTQTWPVVAPSLAPLTLDGRIGHQQKNVSRRGTVMLVARWRRLDAGGEPTGEPIVQRKALRRDLDPGESLNLRASIALPKEPGAYDLEVHVEQIEGSRFESPGNSPDRRRVTVLGTS